MSEKLVFELVAINKATAPLKNVQDEIARTGRAFSNASNDVNQFGRQASKSTKDFQRWAMGSMQQAGYQVGDFAVQVANGTSKMQALGQQGSQLLGVFGPVGAVLGAGVAIFSAIAVAAERASGSTKSLSDALKGLGEQTASVQTKMDMLRFGVNTEEEVDALRRLAAARSKYEKLREQYRNTDSLGVRQRIAEEAIAAKNEIAAIQESVDALIKKRAEYEQAVAINNQMLSIEMAHAKAASQAERERKAAGEAIYRQMISVQDVHKKVNSEQESFNRRLVQAYALYGNLRRQAQGLANDIKAAADKAIDPELFKQYGAYMEYARTRMAAPTEPASDPKKIRGSGKKEDPLVTLTKQISLQEALVGKTKAEQDVINALGADYAKYGPAVIDDLTTRIERVDQLNALLQEQQQIADTIRSSMEDAFMSMVDGTNSVEDAFKNMASSIIKELYRVMVVQRMVNSIMGVVGSIFPSLAPIAGARAAGGTVTGGRPYLVGENGPEVVVPGRTGTVIPNGASMGGGVVVNQSISFGAGVSRAEINAMLPKMVEATKQAVAEAARRGGSYGGSFA